MKAVVIPEQDVINIAEVEIDPPATAEVKVKMVACGVCHSDLSLINGHMPAPFPLIVGHEGAGVVEEVGEGVDNVKPGDHVVLAFVPFCEDCFYCNRGQPYLCEKSRALNGGRQLDGTTRVRLDGSDIGVMTGLGCMAEYAVVPSISVVRIDTSIPFPVAALVGCGVTTGVGAVINTADVEKGSSVAVFGCGGVGLSVIQGARVAGAKTIIAVDLSPEKLELAKSFGATDGLVADDEVVPAIKALTEGRGVDYAFEVIGIAKVMELAYTVTRNGGTTVLVGIGSAKERVTFNSLAFPLKAKTLRGCMYGSCNPPVDFPKMLDLYQSGALDLDAMVTKTYTIDQAAEAFKAMENGDNARGVITFQ